jgi:diguanylate cyclase (GGDEF)-like protein/PAS domain S-box-containing protein
VPSAAATSAHRSQVPFFADPKRRPWSTQVAPARPSASHHEGTAPPSGPSRSAAARRWLLLAAGGLTALCAALWWAGSAQASPVQQAALPVLLLGLMSAGLVLARRHHRLLEELNTLRDQALEAEHQQTEHEQSMAVVLEGAGVGVWEWDMAHHTVSANAQCWAMIGYPAVARHCDVQAWREIMHPDDIERIRQHRRAWQRETSFSLELRLRRPDGHWQWVMSAGAVLQTAADGRVLRIGGVHVDIDRERSARLEAAAARDEAHAALAELDTYRKALDSHASASVTDARGVIVRVNDTFCRISGYPREQLVGTRHNIVNSGVHPPEFWAQMWQTINTGKVWRAEICNRARDGRLYWVDTTIVPHRDEAGAVVEHLAIRIDVTPRKQLEAELRQRALTDTLTDLPNRAVVLDRLQQAIARARRVPGYHFALLFMDFDRFKLVNDSLGHGTGDELLRQIAQRLQQELRRHDSVARGSGSEHTAARIGGDEFVVLLDSLPSVTDALPITQRLLGVLSQPYQIGPHEVHSSASIGMVTSDQAGSDAETVLRDADTAMYEAKRAGRGRAVAFDATMHERVAHSLGLENELRQALADTTPEGGPLYLVYQPVVNLATGRVTSVEALARWNHPERGAVPPVQFIPVAEESGLIGPLGVWALQAACRQFMAWQRELGEHAPSSVAVNLSRAQLQLSQLVPAVREALACNGMAAHHLHLEVTESLAAQDEGVKNTLHQLKQLGVDLSLDDFGTGYSSLACLHELPVDCVKLDRSFVSRAESSDVHRVLIQSTVLMARTLHLRTVAEGVETEGQAALLQSLGCELAQGYLYSRPLGNEALLTWLRSGHVHLPVPTTVA